MYRAMLMVFEGDIDEAVRRLRLALRRDLATENVLCRRFLVDALIESGRIDEAREAIDKAPTIPRLGAHRRAPRAPRCTRNRMRRSMATQHRFDTPCRLRNRCVSPLSFFTLGGRGIPFG